MPRFHAPNLGRDLTALEDAVLADWAAGRAATANASLPVEKRSIAAALIREALFGRVQLAESKAAVVLSAPVTLNGFAVAGDLDLTALRFDLPLKFSNCQFDGGIVLNHARLGLVSLYGSAAKRITADSTRNAGDWDLRGAKIAEFVFADDAQIEGGLYADRAEILGKETIAGAALSLQRARIAGGVYLRDGFKAEGAVNFARATIGGQFACSDGQFTNPGGTALNGDALTVGRDVFLSGEFKAEGQVNLTGAKIGGQLACDGGQFTNPGGTALECDALTVGADVFLNGEFKAEGEVNLTGATIDGQLSCLGGQFTNPGGTALECDALTVGADVYLREGFKAEGEVNFVRAKIGGQLACDGGHFTNPGGTALNGDALTVGADVFLRDKFKAEGAVNFVRAKIGGNLQLPGATFVAPDPAKAAGQVSLNLQGAQIGGTLYATRLAAPIPALNLTGAHANALADDGTAWQGAPAGSLRLDGFTYDRLVDDELGQPVAKTLREPKDRIAWLQQQPAEMWTHDLRPQPWTQIASRLSAAGDGHAARAILRKRAFLRLRHWPWQQPVMAFFARLMIPFASAFAGYGYAPLRAAGWLAALWLFGIAVADRAYERGQIMAMPDRWVQAKSIREHPGMPYPAFDACTYAFDITIPVIPVDAKTFWTPNDRAAPWSGLPESARPMAQPCAIAQAFRALGSAADALWSVVPEAGGAKAMVAQAADAVTPTLGSGFVGTWTVFQTLFGWLFASIAVVGLSGLMRARDQG